ncbi:MAG: hypothetical protein HY362_04815 [Candidatus Aenigmarchaeota archaeon]|nr:hypothetical protein [Candidatus Aenigmarchaeota archaeon]
MINKYHENDEMIVLKNDFRATLFSKLINLYGRKFLLRKLKISSPSLYSYKNKQNVAISLQVLKLCIRLLKINEDALQNNIVIYYKPKELRHKGLIIGRACRREQLKKWRSEIPHIEDVIDGDFIDLEKWFNSYKKLVYFGTKTLENIKKDGNKLTIKHTIYTKGKKHHFTITLPRKVSLDSNFHYFFGLWCGDRVGGGRVGIINKSMSLLNWSHKYLEHNIYQKPKYELYLYKNPKKLKIPNFHFKFCKVSRVNLPKGDWVVCVYSVNGILKKFFDYLNKNLDTVLRLLPYRNIFFAGLFDAEGNVSFEDNYFRWACQNMEKVKIYEKYLKKYNMFNRYDGGSLITNNTLAVSTLILPFLKQEDKKNKARLLCLGDGHLDKKFTNILYIVKNNEGKRITELAKIINRRKLYAQIKFLERFKYVECTDYPKRVYMTPKGITELRREG